MICFSRLDNIAVLAALQAIQASSQQQRSYIGAELPVPPPPLNSAPRFYTSDEKKASSAHHMSSSSNYYPRGQLHSSGGILHQPQHVRTSSGGILMKRGTATPSVNFQENQQSSALQYALSREHPSGENVYPVRDLPTSSESSFCPIPPPPPPIVTSLANLTSIPSLHPPPGKLPAIYPPPAPSSSSTSGGGDQQSMSAEFPLAEPPLEYSTQAIPTSKNESNMFGWSKNKSQPGNGATAAPDVKRGLLSSILEKVRSKDSESPSVGGTTSSSSKDSNKAHPGAPATGVISTQIRPVHGLSLAPLASSESLATTTASVGSVGSTSSVIHKPFEPPGLGKPSRVTPVGLDEADENDNMSCGDRLSATESMSINQDTSSVEVLSVIRFNKSVSSAIGGTGSSLGGRLERATSKISSTSNLSSEKAFSSSSETAATSNQSTALHSLVRQRSADDVLQENTGTFNPCPACDSNTTSHRNEGRNFTAIHSNLNVRRRARSEGRRSRESKSSHKVRANDQYPTKQMQKSAIGDKLFDSEDEADISTSLLTNTSLQRRLSAPEIDENSQLSIIGGDFGTTDIASSEDAASSIISARLGPESARIRVSRPPGTAKGYSYNQSSNKSTGVSPYAPTYYTTSSNIHHQRHRKSRSSPPLDSRSQVPRALRESSKQQYSHYSGNSSSDKWHDKYPSSAQEEYHTSSDSEVGSGGSRPGSRATRSRSPRYSLGSIDSQDLQKAVAHIQETLKLRMEKRDDPRREIHGASKSPQNKSEVTAVVHHSEESPLKEYKERQGENTMVSPAGSTGSKKSTVMEDLGPYDTIKPSRMRKGMPAPRNDNGHIPIKRNNNNNNIAKNKTITSDQAKKESSKSHDSSEKPLLRVQPPALPPKPVSLMSENPLGSSVSPHKPTLERSDSFEGHEEAVRTLVEAVNESRKFEASIVAKQKSYSGHISPSDKGSDYPGQNKTS